MCAIVVFPIFQHYEAIRQTLILQLQFTVLNRQKEQQGIQLLNTERNLACHIF